MIEVYIFVALLSTEYIQSMNEVSESVDMVLEVLMDVGCMDS